MNNLPKATLNGKEITEKDWLIFKDEVEANQAAYDYISESLWAFNTDFILDHAKINYNTRIEIALKKVQIELCEEANVLIDAIICDLDEFVEDAIEQDGRGHFLSCYDGEEVISDEGYYCYRIG